MLTESRIDTETIRILKAMGNMGAKELLQPIKTVIEDRSLPTVVRVQAVYALRKLAKPFEKQVLAQNLLPTMYLCETDVCEISILTTIVI